MGKKPHFIWITQQVRKRDYRKQRVGESEADLCLWTKDNTLDNKTILTVQSNLLCTKLTTFTFRTHRNNEVHYSKLFEQQQQ